MKDLHPAPAEQLALPDPCVVGPLRAEVVARAVRAGTPNQLWQRFGKVSPTLLALPQRLLCSPPRGGEPAHDKPQGCKQGQGEETVGHTNAHEVHILNQRLEEATEAQK